MAAIQDASDLINLLTDGGIPDLDGYVSRLTGGSSGNPEFIFVHKKPRVNGAPLSFFSSATQDDFYRYISMWQLEGTLSHGLQPGGWVNPDNTTPGGLAQTNAVVGNKRLLTASGAATQPGTIVIYDRLAHCGNLSTGTTDLQTVNGGLDGGITRYANGVGNQIWIEHYVTGSQTPNIGATVFYKDGNSISQQSNMPLTGNQGTYALSQRIIEVPMAGNSVTSVSAVQLTGSTATAGTFGITIAHILYEIPVVIVGHATNVGFLSNPMPIIQPNACLALAYKAQGSLVLMPSIELLVAFVDNA